MKYKQKIIIILTITGLILFLKWMNVLQSSNHLGMPLAILLLILIFSMLAIKLQKNIDQNYQEKNLNYQNLDILKYIAAILILVLHLRPFLNYSNEFDLAFNNIITRTCVPIFFVITGYFTFLKEKERPHYIKEYIKKMIPMYLVWSLLYLPIVLTFLFDYKDAILSSLGSITTSPILLALFLLLLLPIVLIIALIYSGIYYHLWYFPALIFSLITLAFWKKKFPVHILLILSFFLLLFGATETYYGVLPLNIQEILSYYYKIFFTTRNFLFFGLFYVVLGYTIASYNKYYSPYCFEKLLISIFLLIFEAIFLHDTNRLNSNILLSCIPLTYYLFISVVYISKEKRIKFNFRGFSKYYYLIHPAIITLCFRFGFMNVDTNPFLQIFLVLMITHLLSWIILKFKTKYKKIPL